VVDNGWYDITDEWAMGGGRRGGATPWGRLATGSLFFEGELLHFPHQRVKLANNISRAANKNNALTELNVSYFEYIFSNLYFNTFGIFGCLLKPTFSSLDSLYNA